MKKPNAFLARLRESVALILLSAFLLTFVALSPANAQTKKNSISSKSNVQSKLVGTPLGAPLWDQSQYDLNNGWMLSNMVVGENFQLVSPRRVTSATIWLGDDAINDNGVLDSFSGTMGVAIYSDNSNLPSAVLHSFTITPTLTDLGTQSGSGGDVFRADLQFPTTVNLAAGSYWIAFHEGAWESGDDLSPVYALTTNATFGSYTTGAFPTAPPSDWQLLYLNSDVAFTLNGAAAWDQTTTTNNPGVDITNFEVKDDFVVSTTTTLTGFTVPLTDDAVNDNGSLDTFGGVLGWTIYSDVPNASGAPVASGNATPLLVDTGVQTSSGSDIVRAEVSFASNVVLPPGTYWLGIREGANFDPADGSIVHWAFTTGINGQMPEIGLLPPPPNVGFLGIPDVAFGLWSLAPTAANVSVGGRVVNQSGFGVGNAIVTMARPDGTTTSVRSNNFGNFVFRDVVVGETYLISASAKRMTFDPQVVSVSDSVSDVTIVGR